MPGVDGPAATSGLIEFLFCNFFGLKSAMWTSKPRARARWSGPGKLLGQARTCLPSADHCDVVVVRVAVASTAIFLDMRGMLTTTLLSFVSRGTGAERGIRESATLEDSCHLGISTNGRR